MGNRHASAKIASLPVLWALLVMLGGCVPDVATEQVTPFSPLPFVSGGWVTAAAAPFPDIGCAAAVGTSIYTFDAVRTMIYDTTTNTWSTGTTMTGSRADFTCTAFGGSIYAVGGYLSTNSAVYLNSIERYDPATDTWTALTGTISARYALGSAEVGGLIYIFGGYDGTQEGFTEFYNPGTDTVSALTGFATPLSDIKGAGDGVDGIWTGEHRPALQRSVRQLDQLHRNAHHAVARQQCGAGRILLCDWGL
jgi:hypothetical protein